MTGIPLIITFTIGIVIMIVSISKFKIHPFLSIMAVSLLLAIIIGLPLKEIPIIIADGFSAIFKNVGIVIILGTLIGLILEKTGGALKLSEIIVKVIGKRHPNLALELMGWVVAIPVFCDSGFVILNPIRKALQQKTRHSSVAMTVALSSGLYIAHVFIPPTPGPIAAAGALGIEGSLLPIVLLGIFVSIPCLAAVYFFSNYIGKRIKTSEDFFTNVDTTNYESLLENFKSLPNGFLSLCPIIVPIITMALGSISSVFHLSGKLGVFMYFIGTPMISLSIGLLLALILLFSTKKNSDFKDITDECLKSVGSILFITAAGGVLGKVIASSNFVDYLREHAIILSDVGIFFPFFIAALLKTAQGSATVAIITTASIMGNISESSSMMSILGFTSPLAGVFVVMAIGAGSMVVSHGNDSFFWVVTNFGKIDAEKGYKAVTVCSLITGSVAILFIWGLSLFML